VRPLQTDLSIFGKLGMEKPPVGVKFLFSKPDGIEQLDKGLALCEMLGEAHRREYPFYISKDNEICFGKQALGMTGDGGPSFAKSGELGVRFGIFQEARANKLLTRHHYSMESGSVNYVIFAPLDKITFEPDLLILMTNARQAEIVLRSMAYSTGEMFESKLTTALSCSWLLVYPYLTGKVNYFITGLAFGSISIDAFPPGWVLTSIPFQWLPTIAQNLKEMEWEPKAFKLGRDGFLQWEKEIMEDLARESQNP
jgi:uncharacterized protein (DUF169 family)